MKTYVDALAALVPSEVLTLHTLMLSAATTVDGPKTTMIDSAVGPFCWAFLGLMVLSIALYAVSRVMGKNWDRLDWIRASIPPLAFLGWTMLQRATAFDAAVQVLKHRIGEVSRTSIGLFIAVALGLVAAALAYRADQKFSQPGGP